jgi:hypothetical protein
VLTVTDDPDGPVTATDDFDGTVTVADGTVIGA